MDNQVYSRTLKFRVNIFHFLMHASDQKKSPFSANGQAMFGHQVGVCHHVGAAIVVVWHCMGA